jgi:hypothetical protein
VVAVASALVGLVLVGDTNPALWTYGYWPVLELMSAAIAFSVGGAVLPRTAKWLWPLSPVSWLCG